MQHCDNVSKLFEVSDDEHCAVGDEPLPRVTEPLEAHKKKKFLAESEKVVACQALRDFIDP